MCKLLIVPKITNTRLAKAFLQAARDPLTEVDRDAIGYVALTDDGTLALEKWTNVKRAFKAPPSPILPDERDAFASILGAIEDPELAEDYASYGNLQKPWKSFIAHSRWATCGKSIENAHPFITEDGEVSLAHNGVIQNPDKYGTRATTCDSEALLMGYQVEDVAKNHAQGLQAMSDAIDGYYAFAAFAKIEDRWLLDIVRDSQASLYCAYVPKLKSIVYATSRDIIRAACKKLKWKYSRARKLKDCTSIRYDAMTGQVLGVVDFKRSTIRPLSAVESYALGKSSTTSAWEGDTIVMEKDYGCAVCFERIKPGESRIEAQGEAFHQLCFSRFEKSEVIGGVR